MQELKAGVTDAAVEKYMHIVIYMDYGNAKSNCIY